MTPKLWPEIEKALQNSRFFVLMADPQSAQSEWVQKEIACWLGTERAENLLIIWTGGEVEWNKAKKDFDWEHTTSLPPMLAGVFEGDEPLYQDLRWAREEIQLSRKDPRFATVLAKLSAAIRGRSLDEIFGDDVREQRRSRTFLWAGITILLLATIFAGWRWWGELQARQEAGRERNAAILQLANVDWEMGVRARDDQKDVLRSGQFFFKSAKEFQSADEGARARNATLAGALASGALICTFPDSAFAVFNRDESRVLTWSADAARLWAVGQNEPIQTFEQKGALKYAMFNRDESRILTWSNNGTVRLWAVGQKEPILSRSFNLKGSLRSVAVNRHANRILILDEGGTARLWALGQNEPIQSFRNVWRAAFNRDESRILTWSNDRTARLWAVGQKEPIQIFEHKGNVNGAVFKRDESRILTWSGDGTARLWDISLDENIPLDERLLDFQVRSATSLYSSGELRSLSLGEWMTASQTLKEMRERRASSK